MCISIIFLTWLQDYIPAKHRAFWSTGIGALSAVNYWLNLDFVCPSLQNIDARADFRFGCRSARMWTNALHIYSTVEVYIVPIQLGVLFVVVETDLKW